MVALNFARATTAGLMMVNSRITDPAMTPTVFNNWYSNVHVQDMVSNNFATVALRYSNYTVNSGPPGSPPAFPLSTNYLALYDVPDLSFLFNPSTAAALPLTDPTFPDPTQLIFTWSAWIFTFWVPTQVFEGLIPGFGRPKYVLMEKIEPAVGGDADLDKWYRTEHLPLLSVLPTYRRSTRYTSSDGSKPRFLALHEVDDINLFMAACSLTACNTLWANKIKNTAVSYETSTWHLFLQKGNANEKLGTNGGV